MMHITVRILGALPLPSRPATAAALLGAGLLLSACGQKGPLFLPPPTVQPVPVKTPAADQSKNGVKNSDTTPPARPAN